jgi:hypothetical protein
LLIIILHDTFYKSSQYCESSIYKSNITPKKFSISNQVEHICVNKLTN